MTSPSGWVVQVFDAVVDVGFPHGALPPIHAALQLTNPGLDARPWNLWAEVVAHRGDGTVRAVAMASTVGLRRGQPVRTTGGGLQTPVGDAVLGRVLDGLGEPIDGEGSLDDAPRAPLRGPAPAWSARTHRVEIIETGIKAIDLFAPMRRGGKLGIFGGAALGKTLLVQELLNNVWHGHGGLGVIAGIGQRTIESRFNVLETMENRFHDGTPVNTRLAQVYSSVGDPPAVQASAALTALTIAEHFRDVRGCEVLLFLDDVGRFAQARAAAVGGWSAEMSGPAAVAREIAALQERIAPTDRGAITAVEGVAVTADELTDPAVAAMLAHFDVALVLSRQRARRGIFPAIDPLRSRGALLQPDIVGERHYRVARDVVALLRRYDAVQECMLLVGRDALSDEDRVTLERALRLERFLAQPLFLAYAFTGAEGRYVKLEDTLRGCEAIVAGAVDALPLQAFYMAGSLDDVRARARTLAGP